MSSSKARQKLRQERQRKRLAMVAQDAKRPGIDGLNQNDKAFVIHGVGKPSKLVSMSTEMTK